MSDTPNLAIPYIAASQAQKHVTHNEALSIIDGLVHLAVISRNTTAPPSTPANGDRYLVPSGATGEWVTHPGQLALRMEGAWRYITPREGWNAWVSDEDVALTYSGTAWIAGSVPTALNNLTMLGVNATADVTNKLSVNSSAVLLNNIGTDVRLNINKNAPVNKASILFQTGFSGRAEIGTTGDDNFHFKVSADGSTFQESIVLDSSTGKTVVKNGVVLDPQPVDPVSPGNGQLWYNSTSGKFRGQQNGAAIDLVGSGGGAASWGTITGSLAAQTDIQNALNGKLDDSQASTFGLLLLDDADATTARSTLGLGTSATFSSTAFAPTAHTHSLSSLTDVTLTSANLNALDDGVDTTLHFHASDRNRANHAGTQLAATISDFNAAADGRIAASSVNALSDVVIASPATGQVIKFNGTNWINDTDAASAGGGGQAALQFQDEGTNLGTPGTIDAINVVGDNLVATRSGNTLTVAQKAYKRNARWAALSGVNTIIAMDASALSATGTATVATQAVTNIYTQQMRMEYLVTTAATTAIASWRHGVAQWWRGNAAGLGGFRYRCRWGNATGAATTTSRCFVGMQNAVGTPTDVEPSTLLNMIGMGWGAADVNIQLMTNAGSGTATKTDLGAGFPVPTTDRSALYDIELSCDPNSTLITYRVVNVISGAVEQGTLSANLPVNNVLLAPRGWMSVGGTSSVIGIAFMFLEIGSD